jgi:hypothetical protein
MNCALNLIASLKGYLQVPLLVGHKQPKSPKAYIQRRTLDNIRLLAGLGLQHYYTATTVIHNASDIEYIRSLRIINNCASMRYS